MNTKILVVLIPAFNEEQTIGQVIRLIPRKIKGVMEVKVLVIDDGSSDKTVEQARKAKADKIVSHSSNKGLGEAFRTGIREALKLKADIIVNIDADLQFNPKDIPKLIQPIQKKEADMVTASRFKDKSLIPEMPWVKKFGNNFFTKIVNLLTAENFTDTQCGFRAYSREAALRLNLFGKFTYTQEVFLELLNKKMRIKEIPLKIRGERKGKSKIVKSWYGYGLKSLLIIIRSVRDHHPLKFFGSIGLIVFLIGLMIALWLFSYWIRTGHTTPFTSLIPVSTLIIIIGFLLIVLALIADMFGRQKNVSEKILYYLRKKEFEK